MKGNVTLVGAGCGDPKLLTLGGKFALEHCDVVVHDRLISAELLAFIPENTEKINVGKEAGNHPIPQEKINQMLLELALEGKNVVRLKGGDSFLFGRGGEELDLLKEHNIEFSVIPGITSPFAVATYGGFPVTHREKSSSVHIFTGHSKHNTALDFDYQAMVKLKGTLIFLMSIATMPTILSELLKAGISPELPMAVVEKGSSNQQKTIKSTVKDMVTLLETEMILSPAIFYLGEVCSLDYDWFTSKSLFGKNILISSPDKNKNNLAQLLQEEGANVVTASTLCTKEIEVNISDFSAYTCLIFTSKRGVDSFFHQLNKAGFDSRIFSSHEFAVVGESTKNQLKQYGIMADFMPTVYDSSTLISELLESKTKNTVKKEKYLLIEGTANSDKIQEILKEKQQDFDSLICYDIEYEKKEIPPDINYDLVVFTSGNTVKSFVKHHGHLTNLHSICIGKTTEKVAKEHGFTTSTSEIATLPSVVECIKEYFYDSQT